MKLKDILNRTGNRVSFRPIGNTFILTIHEVNIGRRRGCFRGTDAGHLGKKRKSDKTERL